MSLGHQDPDHPIIEHPWKYSIVGLAFFRTLDNTEEAYIDLTLQSGSIIRRLRFFSPQDIYFENGFPESPGLCIRDVSKRGMENLRIQVDDFEAGPGGIHFWARDVVDLDEIN
jgi:hypothetical protein